MTCGECNCGYTADIDIYGYCVAESEGLERFDCNTEGRSCEELAEWSTMSGLLEDLALGRRGEPASEREQRLYACADKAFATYTAQCLDSNCECYDDSRCKTSLESMCPLSSELGCPLGLDALRAPRVICENDGAAAVYSECDDGTVSVEWTTGGENDYRGLFRSNDRRTDSWRRVWVRGRPVLSRASGVYRQYSGRFSVGKVRVPVVQLLQLAG